VRSEVVAQKEFELEFPFSGTVAAVYVHDGDIVSSNQRLMKLETTDLDIQARQLQAAVDQSRAGLAKLLAGATPEQIQVSQSKLASAQVARTEAVSGLIDKIKDAYTKSDDAVRAQTDQLFDSPRSASPTLISNITSGSAVRDDLDAQRPILETTLNAWNASLATLATASDLTAAVQTAKQNTALVSKFLDTLAPVLSNLVANSGLSQATIDGYKANVSAARSEMSTATAALIAAEEKYKLAVANVALYENELALERAPARSEDVAIAETQVSEAQSQLDAALENIRRSTLYAPLAGNISKVHYEVGEVFRPGQSAVSMATDGYKLQSDVSELNIAKVHVPDGNTVHVVLDAFPGQQFPGKVVSVDAQEVVKTEDKYYRVNIIFDADGANIRSGMSADATILSSVKKGVLRVPELAVYTDGKTKYLKVLLPGLTKAVSEASVQKVTIETGINDGEYVEVLRGAQEGQTVAVSAE
jgi:RND family efflux transporter MFP subunit